MHVIVVSHISAAIISKGLMVVILLGFSMVGVRTDPARVVKKQQRTWKIAPWAAMGSS